MNDIKELVTTTGKKFVIKSFLSFEEVEPVLAIEDNLKKSAKLIETALVSFEGDTKDAYAKIRKLSVADYGEIAAEVTKVLTGNFPQGK